MKISVSGLVAILFVACSSAGSDEADQPASTTIRPSLPTTSSASTSTSSSTVPPVTVIERVPAPELGSTGEITIGPREYAFAFECYAAGAGDVLALGVGDDPESGERTQAVVQAFLGQPYVAVVVGERTVLELAIDRHVELFQQESKIIGSALRFVDATDGAGEGVEAGLGTVSVMCESFAPGLPDGYSSGGGETEPET